MQTDPVARRSTRVSCVRCRRTPWPAAQRGFFLSTGSLPTKFARLVLLVSKNIFYEEEGDFKVGTILADNNTSLQVEAPHGKRSKVKASAVLFRFDAPPIAGFMDAAQNIADEIDVDFLWQCCGEAEFSYDTLAREYFGHAPSPVESAGVLLRLHGAPMYFYKKGRGRYKAAPEDALKAALASIERKKQQALRKQAYIEQLAASRLPPEFAPVLDTLLYRPDRNSIEWKALEEASAALKMTPARLVERCGGLPSSHDYHVKRFLLEYFPRGTDFGTVPPVPEPVDLPPGDAEAFSIDDATTTEIDDAFSVSRIPGGNWRIGIHIAAPALGIAPGSPIDAIARARLSTVYYPGAKITMLPEAAIRCFTLAENRPCPALSLYIETTPGYDIVSASNRIERLNIGANLRHDALEQEFNEQTLAAGAIDHRYANELRTLWEFADRLERARRGEVTEAEMRPEYNFYVENDRVTITRRRRGTPIDRMVSELMIFANREWGRQLAANATAAIFRVQGNGKVRMSTVPAGHEGLGVEQYVWASSPLRRYVDLLNQRQLVALTRGEPPPCRAGDEALLSAMRDFELTYEAYGDFQRTMERYWCLRWLTQEDRSVVEGRVIRENLVRLEELPLVVRVPSLPALEPGTTVELAVADLDFLELTLRCEFRSRLEIQAEGASRGS
ncbi:MAG: RNB domain-containing ribonuclease [Betaproteobacteria bacterium]|nr:RNB domain-containing ribonuclease [Betaproteobacteria bacterium]